MSAAELLDRLQRVRGAGPGRWVASCPAHEDRSPSLSIRELEDGRVLLHDFAGCDVDAILGAVGLELSVLFPPRDPSIQAHRGQRRPWTARQLLTLAEREIRVATFVINDNVERRSVNRDEMQRLALAAGRLGVLVDEL